MGQWLSAPQHQRVDRAAGGLDLEKRRVFLFRLHAALQNGRGSISNDDLDASIAKAKRGLVQIALNAARDDTTWPPIA
jgi:hypothetical protein